MPCHQTFNFTRVPLKLEIKHNNWLLVLHAVLSYFQQPRHDSCSPFKNSSLSTALWRWSLDARSPPASFLNKTTFPLHQHSSLMPQPFESRAAELGFRTRLRLGLQHGHNQTEFSKEFPSLNYTPTLASKTSIWNILRHSKSLWKPPQKNTHNPPP